MKIKLALLAALSFSTGSLRAQITLIDPAYQYSTFLTHTTNDAVVSYDWASNGSVYYQTSTSSYNFGGLYRYSGSTPTQVVAGSPSLFSGISVVSIGDYVYFNASDFSNNQNIYKYGPVGSSPGATVISTAPNYGLYSRQGNLFITGSPSSGINHIYYSGLAANGDLTNNPPIDLGEDAGGSGPLAFDLQGNLFYAPGFGDLSIYRWTAAEVSLAMNDPAGHPLDDAGHRWLDYSSRYGNVSGGSSMLIDRDGRLLLTLTSFTDPSLLVRFGIAGDGSFDGSSSTLLRDTGRLGELRSHDGSLFFSSDNHIFQIVPEPSALALVALAMALLLVLRPRRQTKA